MRHRLSTEEYTRGILAGDRLVLSRAITVIESRLAEDKDLAARILRQILPRTGGSLRIGITGIPGVGKSTFIEAFGRHITAQGKSVAVLAIDPSSKRSGGSILGDKTRMEELSRDSLAFIRPSATGLSLGGVARSTRETMLLCEASGFDVILIETVGVGQSETLVKGMTDFFLLLMLAGAGNELQGIKKGIMEMADLIAINKADGHDKDAAMRAVTEYQQALHLFPKTESGFSSKVIPCSALENTGIEEIWDEVIRFSHLTRKNGFFEKTRQLQNLDWMHDYIRQTLEEQFYGSPAVKRKLASLEKAVGNNQEPPLSAARQLIDIFMKKG